MMRKTGLSFTNEKDPRIKIMNEKLNSIEKNIAEFCSAFSGMSRKIGGLRDRYDDLARVLKTFSDEEIHNKTLVNGLNSMSKALTILGDFLDLELHRIENKIITDLSQYEVICRNTRESLKTAAIQRDKEASRYKQMLEFRNKFVVNTTAASSEVLNVQLEVNKTNKEITSIMENFERKKLKDIKGSLLNFIRIQLKQHTKSIEVLSAVYQDVDEIDEEKDFQDFKAILKLNQKDDLKNHWKKSTESLDGTYLAGKSTEISKKYSKNNKKLINKINDEQSEAIETNDSDEDDDENEDDITLPSKLDINIDDNYETSDTQSDIAESKQNSPIKVAESKNIYEGFRAKIHK